MNNIVSLEDNSPHRVAELMCVRCKKRWICVWPDELRLKQIECPYCKKEGFVINTGEEHGY